MQPEGMKTANMSVQMLMSELPQPVETRDEPNGITAKLTVDKGVSENVGAVTSTEAEDPLAENLYVWSLLLLVDKKGR
jgi:hypothetical protein